MWLVFVLWICSREHRSTQTVFNTDISTKILRKITPTRKNCFILWKNRAIAKYAYMMLLFLDLKRQYDVWRSWWYSYTPWVVDIVTFRMLFVFWAINWKCQMYRIIESNTMHITLCTLHVYNTQNNEGGGEECTMCIMTFLANYDSVLPGISIYQINSINSNSRCREWLRLTPDLPVPLPDASATVPQTIYSYALCIYIKLNTTCWN